jgi:hypothetical protein
MIMWRHGPEHGRGSRNAKMNRCEAARHLPRRFDAEMLSATSIRSSKACLEICAPRPSRWGSRAPPIRKIVFLRNRLHQLDADNKRLRQQLASFDQRAWWQSYHLTYEDYVGLETEAVAILAFQSAVVHGLLQTADYARAGHEAAIPRFSSERIEMHIEAKLRRQGILLRDNPPRLAVILDEAALHRISAGYQVMAAQLDKIVDRSALPNVTVQVLPYDQGAHPALESNFTILELPGQAPGVVFVEGLIGSIYLKATEDLGRYQRYREVFERLQSIALSPAETSDLIARLSQSYLAMCQQNLENGESDVHN